MKSIIHLKQSQLPFLLIILLSSIYSPKVLKGNELNNLKPRVIVLTDLKRVHETDDFQSIVRLLALADLVEIEGIIISSGFNYWNESHLAEGYKLVWEVLDAYEETVQNLMKMNGQESFELYESRQEIGYWPSTNYLKQRTALGKALVGMDYVGNGKSNEGSNLIVNIVDESDPRPVFVLVWGGANVLAQSIWDISENPMMKRSSEAVNAFIDKLRVIAIVDQDKKWTDRNKPNDFSNTHYWMRKTFPDLFWVMATPGEFTRKSNELQPFYQMHVQGHGALGDMYPDHSNSVEGDTPSLLYVLPLGLSDPEKPEWGGMAGMFERKSYALEEGTLFWQENHSAIGDIVDVNKEWTIRFIRPVWNMFAARLDWARGCTGNRPPIIVMNGEITNGVIEMAVNTGETITLDASKSFDNEMDKLQFEWTLLPVPGSYNNSLKLENTNNKVLHVEIPKDAKKKEIHILLTLTDDGAAHHLSAYQRVVLKGK